MESARAKEVVQLRESTRGREGDMQEREREGDMR